jgi:hypothetical protein
MANKQGEKAVAKKSGAKKKGGLTAIEGGKGKAAPEAPPVLLRDGKTEANPDALRRALGVYGVAVKEGASTADLLAAVRKHLAPVLKKMPDDDKIKCADVCGEVSTNDTDFCPFCGDEGSEEGEEGDEAGAAEAAEEGEPAAESVVKEEAEPEPEAPAPAPAPKAPKGKAAKATPAPAPEAPKGDGLIVATKKLEASIERINQLRNDLAGNSYDLGTELRTIHEEELWKARGHETFKDFIEKDLEISRSMAYRLIDVTKQFDRPTFESVGSRKLALIAGIQDSEARDAALEAAKAGASTKDVERARDEAKGRSAKEKPEAPTAKKAPNEITLLAKVGSKPELVGFRSAATGKAIGKHKDDAYAEKQISEGVKLRMAPKFDRENNLVGITVAFVRVE